jgi:uncharacterized protein
MKLLLVLAVVMFGIWLWRSNRAANSQSRQQEPQTMQVPLEMVACALCSVHVSTADAIQGIKGAYCCLDHRQRMEP